MRRPLAAGGLRRLLPAPPVRIVHLGLGAFSRSHTAWYTDRAADAAQWGISAYTGRSRELADRLATQGGLYTLIERGVDGDVASIVESVVSARPGSEAATMVAEIAARSTSVVTLTVTEAGYRLDSDDHPSRADPVVGADHELLTADLAGRGGGADPSSALGRLVRALERRRLAYGGPISLLSCDNLPDNGGRLGRGLTAWAEQLSPQLSDWTSENVTFVSSSVDRITPRVDHSEVKALTEEYSDAAPVVAEPFSDWVISGQFGAGRPDWESAGARFVRDLEPWEARKLWMLNGAHTLLASLGQLRGHRLVAEAIADPECRRWVEGWWDEAADLLPAHLDVPRYRTALLGRFANGRVAHSLAQIAADSALKLRLRIAPVALRRLAAGSEAESSAFAIAAWILAGERGLLPERATAGSISSRVATIDADLARHSAFVATVESHLASLRG